MKKLVVSVLITIFIMIVKLVVSGAYFDYYLQKKDLADKQLEFIDENKRKIAKIEYYKSPHYLFKLKEELAMSEITPEKTVIISAEDIFNY